MKHASPKITIGLPVYNGEDFLVDALKSILGQTYRNIELLISDNASDDRTESICREFASNDKRVSYSRMNRNVGAARNFNQLVSSASGEFFKWAAHDDIIAEDYVQRCVSAFEEDSELVWVHCRSVDIDDNGEEIGRRHWNIDLHSWIPHRRFADAILVNHECLSVFGVIRTNVLRNTDLIGSYVASDRVLIAQLALQGRYGEIPIYGFKHREHSKRSTKAHAPLSERQLWFDPSQKNYLPNARLFRQYFKSINQAPIGRQQKAYCYLHLARWVVRGGQSF
jgi:glycosyltransferase involved in cell wall biosynthesis